MNRSLVLVLALAVCSSVPALAQEKGQVGLALGYPTAVVLVWHPSDTLAVRPQFSFARSTVTSDPVYYYSGSSQKAWGVSFGGDLQIYTSRHDQLRTYLSPRFIYSRTKNDSGSNSVNHGYEFSGSFGAQYALTKRFSVYAEAGIRFEHSRTTYDTMIYLNGVSSGTYGQTTTKSDSWGPRTAVGAILYF